MIEALESAGNASSIHYEGRKARSIVEAARRKVAKLVGASPDSVIFTSGATEAAQMALSPQLQVGKQIVSLDRLVISAVEHPCIMAGGRFAVDNMEILPVTRAGIVDIEAMAQVLSGLGDATGGFLVAIQMVNNETGIIQPVAEAAKIIHAAGGYLLVDAVQAAGRIPVDIAELGADFIMLSAHKMGGPQGIGALVLANKGVTPSPLLRGGAQENHHRAGTENVAALAGFGAAATKNTELLSQAGKIAAFRDSIEATIMTISTKAGNAFGPVEVFGNGESRVANTLCFAVPGILAETALIALDLDGVAVSSGSACSSGSVGPSHVLAAMGVDDELSRCALRVSLGWKSQQSDVDHFVDAWTNIVDRMSARASKV